MADVPDQKAGTKREKEALDTSGYYHGQLWRSAAEDLVQKSKRPGSFLVRECVSYTKSGKLTDLVITALTYPDPSWGRTSEIVHHRIDVDYRGFFSADGELFFRSVQDLVLHHNYTRKPLTIAGVAVLDYPITRPPWQILSPDIELIQPQGSGQFGILYTGLVWREESGRRMAVKAGVRVMEGADDRKLRRMFITDTSTLLSLAAHSNVITLLGCCLLEEQVKSAKEMSELGSLRMLILAQKASLSPHRTHLARQIANAACYMAKKGMIHLDLTSTNFLAFKNAGGEGYRLKLSNFHHCCAETRLKVSDTRGLALRWCAPEVVNLETATQKADVWSAGLVIWELHAEGWLPFHELQDGPELGSRLVEAVEGGLRPCLTKWAISKRLKGLLADTWDYTPHRRPSIFAIRDVLDDHLAYDNSKLRPHSKHPSLDCLS